MNRCFANSASWQETPLPLDMTEVHHLRHVLRVGDGDEVIVFDGQGREAVARAEFRGRDSIVLTLLEDRGVAATPNVRFVLFQSIPKGRHMDMVVEKATELGASVVVPMITDRGVVRIPEDRCEERRERWFRIGVSAAKQCGNPWVPEIAPIVGFGDAMVQARALDAVLVGSLAPDARALPGVMREIRERGVTTVGVIVGPEGDLAAAELQAAAAAGAIPVTFGAQVLRSETAAVFGLSILSYELRRLEP